MDYNSILGVVLAGGQSKRFGQDKSQVQLGGKILIDYILLEILDQFNEILIISNNDIKFLNSKKITKIEDYKKDLGPLGGVLTAMRWIKKNNRDYKWISTFPSDTPFFKKKYLSDFIKNIDDKKSKLFFIKSNDKRHNIFGLWSTELLDRLEDDVTNKGERKVEIWANKVGVKTINMEFKNNDPFFNINTKEDLEKAKELIKNND
ncbi:MAG: molybdenum cofactor guanylyltransferase [Proteobacteria bacterium]|uniref:Molybdenum cofactor guanylyltransferase n=1 Tax=Candidatus Fonsibacter lacus TaxID=2576439 RepID=A0A845SAX6_9PROT|nr:molybdenum cofactor guanylyltransferase [Pseudomonadota bacterium]NCU62988.1 molybdenum cofactor guanylyltransferase [Candidatus Fonsibacter lacus]NCU71926.1 molybdenum cofactor guanylyltransferase [Candidatus Fonsibacter lacus]NDE64464.1 molybdenum cofactor guanylyltransferase [Pseudomonadota bacterium]NDF57448.1 molybdenum cofactor guanylyltransferase [Pseudomonadota bacterium]